MKANRTIVAVVAVLMSVSLMSGADETAIRVMPRVNMADSGVQRVLNSWIDSLDAWRGLGSVATGGHRDGPFATGSQHQIMSDWFGQSEFVLKTFPPTILSVEQRPGSATTPEYHRIWTIRTMFSSTEPETHHVIPLGIMRTQFGERVDGALEALDPISEHTARWTSTTVGRLTFLIPPDGHLDMKRARMADDFITTLSRTFDVSPPSNITMYVAPDRDAMCELFGLEYYAFPPSGLAYPEAGMMMTSLGDPLHYHELVHMTIHDLEARTYPILREGVATWLGGSTNVSTTELLATLMQRNGAAPLPSLEELMSGEALDQEAQYILAAVIADAVHELHGIAGIKMLLTVRDANEAIQMSRHLLGFSQTNTSSRIDPFIESMLSKTR